MFLFMQLQTALALLLGEPDTAFDIHKTTYRNAPVRLSNKLDLSVNPLVSCNGKYLCKFIYLIRKLIYLFTAI